MTRLTLSLAGAATSIILVATKHVFCRDKNMLAVTNVLSRQNYVCRDKIFLSRQTSRQKFCLRQAYFCRDKRRVLS